MIKIYNIILEKLINLIDGSNKKKIIKNIKKNILDENLIILDIGAHKGETLDLFIKNLSIKKIFCFEPNEKVFTILK